VDPAWIADAEVVGLTSGASAPEWLVERMLAYLASLGATEVQEIVLTQENLRFSNVRV
jgi:4-hydroxy-3-methylbut-2-enyl diphosphate reductase